MAFVKKLVRKPRMALCAKNSKVPTATVMSECAGLLKSLWHHVVSAATGSGQMDYFSKPPKKASLDLASVMSVCFCVCGLCMWWVAMEDEGVWRQFRS